MSHPGARGIEETAGRGGGRARRGRTALLTGDGDSLAFDLPSRGELVIGRDPGADIVFAHESLSRRHARLLLEPGSVQLCDLESKNGTRIGARRLVPGRAEALRPGAAAELGAVLLLVVEPQRGPSRPRTRETDADHDLVITPALEGLDDVLKRASVTDLPILLLGETGVGKDVFAERVHALSPRASRRLVRVHAAAIAEPLFESELFGHEQGAFTGATAAKAGLLEAADGGTVFIDEVGELPASIQVKLLRVLDDRRIQRVGAITPRKVDVRFVAATNRDLATEVARGVFRQDLYQRLRGVSLRVPPLRERRDDVRILACAFLRRVADDKRFSEAALRALSRQPFWGNVRELRNLVERTALLVRTEQIGQADLVFDAATAVPGSSPDPAPAQASQRQQIVVALEKARGNQTVAAGLLGMSRRALVYKLTEYGIPRPRKTVRKTT
ncbi:MAG: FHA domain-containing protein [Deltaproteobacteria bacterium]|nr:MAG: FHA domain-containing protein [Deltaproteobacteria bacterium]